MKIKITYTLLFCIYASAFSQKVTDSIMLNNVELKNYKSKIKKVSIGSLCTHYEPMIYSAEIITLADDLPSGYLQSVTFNFNNKFHKNQEINFQDSEIQILFYKVNPDNTPGELISTNKNIIVRKEHVGKMEIDVRDLNILTEGKLFIGLSRITKNTTKLPEFEVNCVCWGNKGYFTYERPASSSEWSLKKYGFAALKMEVKTELTN